ncbi:hypothetical protein EKN06_00500 [Croceicoccus ponticola]|uniref:Uncharacterized protein n=1 Tax=Croceicoccus ponticola TaxID=2217664 RepID=A0A437GZI4_9SPHN|nr:hypothetical protein [Croceicoccus ponticola]RVQ68749.1 hypothetical protein EKN06_00500 [Croceicoccus ponticola]
MLKKIALGACLTFGLIATANGQTTNSRRTPVSLESLGGVAPLTAEDLKWTKDYPVNVQPILADWVKYNGACRGGPSDRVKQNNLEEWMSRVCSARDATVGMMRLYGYCYGREGEAGVDNEWHACTRISYGNDYLAQ